MSDTSSIDSFFEQRNKSLWERFPGHYRAQVVETNDPLSIGRVRFKCPDLHDFGMDPNDYPWAVCSFDLGGDKAGKFSSPCINDWIWVTFEKQHPYGPIWTGFSNPTRTRSYTLPQISQPTPLSLNRDGKIVDAVKDFDIDYLPTDGRPMAYGWQDRYGNLDISSSVGFYPASHENPPPAPDGDALSSGIFNQQQNGPSVNSPDKKYMSRVTKYGNISIMSDQGYMWRKTANSGEFTGDSVKDENFEIERWKFIQRLLNEDSVDGDSRRIAHMTRYGSRIEIRDTGWAQIGPKKSGSRKADFGSGLPLSTETKFDHRWIKLRTKGGMLFQAYDKGFDPSEDRFIKRGLLEEQGSKSEKEDEYWADKDARWIRIVTRYGLKIVLDDRGTDNKNADNLESPRANGILFKGRRSPGSALNNITGDPRGFHFEFNENDKANHTTWSTPNGMVVEMNDRYQYTMLSASMGKQWTPTWKGLAENEFIRKPTILRNPELNSHHCKLDHHNEYIRFKTRGGRGESPDVPVNGSDVDPVEEINQGLEARDGKNGLGPWVEVVDCQHRGFWFSKGEKLGVWRGPRESKMFQVMDDGKGKIVIYNGKTDGTVEIFADGSVNIISSGAINIESRTDLNLKAAGSINMQAGSSRLTIGNGVSTNGAISARSYLAGSGSGKIIRSIKVPELPEIREPNDRGQTYNGPFIECPINEVEHLDI